METSWLQNFLNGKQFSRNPEMRTCSQISLHGLKSPPQSRKITRLSCSSWNENREQTKVIFTYNCHPLATTITLIIILQCLTEAPTTALNQAFRKLCSKEGKTKSCIRNLNNNDSPKCHKQFMMLEIQCFLKAQQWGCPSASSICKNLKYHFENLQFKW